MANIILGISAFYHDSAAALLAGDEIVAAAHEERFSRKKHDAAFPFSAVDFVLAEGGVKISDLDAFYDKPFLKFERLLETYHAFAPRGFRSFLTAIPVWIREKLFMRKILWESLEKVQGGPIGSKPSLLFPEHHLSHAASAFFPSPFETAAILTIDGVGEWTTTAIGMGQGTRIESLGTLAFPHSLGLLYSAFTYYTGFKVNSGEYKLMGLAPYGNPKGEACRRYKDKILEELIQVKADGSFVLNMEYFDYPTGLRMCNEGKWAELFQLPARREESDITQPYMDMALAIQQVTEEVVLRLARTAKTLTQADHLVMAGGVALNCVANGKLLRSGLFKDIWIQPAAGDAGGAVGAAYAALHISLGKERTCLPGGRDKMHGGYLGPEYGHREVLGLARKYGARMREYENFEDLCRETAGKLAAGNAVGWFQGRMEWGPRALGNRSILGDPRNKDMQRKMNLKIKFREGFRPFAPSVLAEDAAEYFELDRPSPYMLLVADVRAGRRKPIPEGYEGLGLYERLYHIRSDIPAVTHVDFSARIQTVHRETNEKYWRLLKAFKELTGCSLLVNTSFNVRGEPIVCTPGDAYRCFMRTEMDYLVIDRFLFTKTEQPPWAEDLEWRTRLAPD